MKRAIIVLLINWITAGLIYGNVKMPAIFNDNMVLQRNMAIPVWGWADPGERVHAVINGHSAETKAAGDGKWRLDLDPQEAGGPYQLIITGNNTIKFENVLIGEVWVCSGQSNMAMEVQECMNSAQEIRGADHPQIRHFQVKRIKSAKPLDDVSPVDNPKAKWLNTWEVCTPLTAGHFSGTAYFFALDLYRSLNIPVGIIHASWGGTTAEAWTPSDVLEADSVLSIIQKHWPDYNNDEEWLRIEYANYTEEIRKAKSEGTGEPLYFNQPSVLFNGIIAPVIPYGIKGVAWYQGESNAYRAYQYRRLLPAMISGWRGKWGQGSFPFLIVQLANYQFEPQVFPELREAQDMARELPNTAIAVTIDIGDPGNIHPVNKQEVGHRLSLAARAKAYGEDLVFSGPSFRSMYIAGDSCFISMTSIGDGLVSVGKKTLSGFTIAGDDRVFYDASASIAGNTIILWSGRVHSPVAVRYAWFNNPEGLSLYNKISEKSYLPAHPFRTDDWPGLTYLRK